ncbi:MAG: hypothetical protein ACLQIB_49220 [Isosphaeraceae bacterium]
MKPHRRYRRPATGYRRFILDSLEPRCLLATGLPGINAVTLDRSTTPPQVEITFDQNAISQIVGMLPDGFGSTSDLKLYALLNFVDSDADFEIDQLASDGTIITQILGPDNPPPVENVTTVTIAGSQEVQVSIPIPGPALAPGNYQVCVEGATVFDLLADAIQPGPAWDSLSSSFQPVAIGQFAVNGQGASFQNASPLPAPGSGVTTITGYLNPDDYRFAVDLYQFTLGPTPGNLWQVGLAVQANSIGSMLQADVTLFRSDGSVVASALSGTGLPSDPGDPYLFAGLQPGTYFVGVSGAGYLPYGTSGYNPELGIPGVLGFNQPGGPFPFQLSLAAVPHSQPTTVTGSSMNWLDPLSSSPTSLNLGFSGPIDLSNLFVVDQAEDALELVDSAGRIWPITAGSYDTGQHQLALIIDEPLPAGAYSLVSPADDALRDLAGQAVIAPGEPAGELATFTVSARAGLSIPGNLGVLWPEQIGAAPSSIGDTFSESVELDPGQAVTYRFVAIVAGLYKLQTVVDGGSISVQQIGASQTSTLDAGSADGLNNYFMNLDDGVYQIRFANVGSQPTRFEWLLKIGPVDWEKITGNGIGQSEALALGLLLPPVADPNPSPAPTFQGPVTFQAADVTAGSSGPIPSNLLFTLNTSLMGQPGSTGSEIASVGPSVDGTSVALADGASGLIPGIHYVSMFQTGSSGDIGPVADVDQAGSKDRSGRQAKGANAPEAADRLDPDATSILADQRAMPRPEWLLRVAGTIRDWFGPTPSAALIARPDRDSARLQTTVVASLGPEAFATGPRRGRSIGERNARADIEFPAGLLVVAVAACRLQDPVRRWWRRRTSIKGIGHRTTAPLLPAPHSSSTLARARTRIHK